MPEEDKNTLEVQVQEPETPPNPEAGSVEIPLDNKPVAAQKPDDGGFRVTEENWRNLHNTVNGFKRVTDKIMRDLSEIKPKVTAVQQPAHEPQTQDELDALVANGNWKDAVKKLAAKEAAEIIAQREAARVAEQEQNARNAKLERNKQTVIAKYPELDPENGDPQSPVSLAFVQAYTENPDYLRNEYGPLLAMQDMEKYLAERGIQPRRSIAQTNNSNYETVRKVRANATSLPPSRPAGKTGNSYTISREQKELIEAAGINPEAYARIARTLDSGAEGVEVQ